VKLSPLHPLPRTTIVDREAFVHDVCAGKRVLHVGCANWPFTQKLLEEGKLAHHRLAETCTALAGVDMSKPGIALLERAGIEHVFAEDLTNPLTLKRVYEAIGWEPEVILASEVLEHVDAPGAFLRNCADHMPATCRLVLTVPSALSLKGVLHNLLGHEKVHTDHVAYYSYVNMLQLASRCGLRIATVRCYKSPSEKRVEKFLVDPAIAPLLRWRPFLSDGLVFVFEKRADLDDPDGGSVESSDEAGRQ
jgi:SAM-dependent methyltransferase